MKKLPATPFSFPRLFKWIGYYKCFFALRDKCPCPKISRIRSEYRDLRNKSPYSVKMQGETAMKNSENGYFLRSAKLARSLVQWRTVSHLSCLGIEILYFF